MRFNLIEVGDDACRLTENTSSCSTGLTIPMAKTDLVELILTFLQEPERRDASSGAIRIERMRDGPRIHAGAGDFTIPYAHVFPLVIDNE
ncbi:MAG: hypothetical protein ACJA2X_000871 [Halocynthiibacter sp.]|jgi:hypothetical protein